MFTTWKMDPTSSVGVELQVEEVSWLRGGCMIMHVDGDESSSSLNLPSVNKN
jgi:hypothetical protein